MSKFKLLGGLVLEENNRIKNYLKCKFSYALSVVDRIVIRMPLRFDGVSSGKLVRDACEFVNVELYETGIAPASVGYVISSLGFDKP